MGRLSELESCTGTLGQSSHILYNALHLRDEIYQALEKLSAYARLRLDEDTTQSHYQAFIDRITRLGTRIAVASASFTPEILAIPPEMLTKWLNDNDNPDLVLYSHEIDDIVRLREHIRSEEIESILADSSEIMQGPSRTFTMLNNADLRLPLINIGETEPVQLSLGNYNTFIQSPHRETRKVAFTELHTAFKEKQNTIAATFSSSIKGKMFNARQRHFKSTIEANLSAHNIPLSVYHNLIESVNDGLPILHRYLRLRQRVLQLDPLHMYDLHIPLAADVEIEIPFNEGKEIVLQALQPLGDEYTRVLHHAMEERWIDVLENQGKRSGAYSMGVFGVHPYILLNYQNNLRDVFTLAHELGHTLHSYYSSGTQPYLYAHYTIFIAEIASTFNEALLVDHLMHTMTETSQRIYILDQYLSRLYSTLFRQTMFADFELQAHTLAESGKSLTSDLLCSIYADLNKRYFGEAGVIIDELTVWEWARIPHFYRNFYVYQYATGVAASTALARAALTEGTPAIERYITLLQSGSSDYSIELLKRAGIDMTTPEPVRATLNEFSRILDEIEALLGM
jgi:oligoendopeptidase F